MKILVLGNRDRYEQYMPDMEITKKADIVYCKRGSSDEELLEAASDADAILADPMGCISGNVIRNMPNLKLLQSEGVGYNNFDIQAASERGIYLLPEKYQNKILFSPHIGGITRGSFLRSHRIIWENVERISKGEKPEMIVNGL